MTTITKNVSPVGYRVRTFITAPMQKYPFIFSDEWKYRIQRHVAFWLFWWIFQAILYSFVASNTLLAYVERLPMALLESFLFMFTHMFLAYSLMYFVIPVFLLKQKYWPTAVVTIILFFITAFISTLIGRFIVDAIRENMMRPENNVFRRTTSATTYLSLLSGLRGGITIGGIAAAIKLMKYWYLKEQRNLQLQKENAESQLQLLKAQVHPHFLFNTLNNIYSYTQNNSPIAGQMVTGLSDLLRSILYECNQRVIPLSKELKMIQDYINLEQIRYGDKLDLHVDIPAETNDLYIAPLLLLPLVENSFKHGASNMLDQPWISLRIAIDNKQMHMKLVNGKIKEPEQKTSASGIGINNVKKRLELVYPEKNQLLITNDDEVFIVSLKIQLEQIKETVRIPQIKYEAVNA
ncbi:MAG: histidine kinase [Chitinophagaceae bacterium]